MSSLLEEYAAYLADLEDARAGQERASMCGAPWPADPPHPGYLGTRCSRQGGHPPHHRVQVGGLTVEWA